MDELGFLDAEIVVEEIEELAFHEVWHIEVSSVYLLWMKRLQLTRLGSREQASISVPVLVLGARIVQVLGGYDEGSQEDAVSGAVHALCDLGKTVLESIEVDERA